MSITIPSVIVFGGREFPVDPKVWQHVYKQAQQNKEWAESHEYCDSPDSWPASGMSIEMLKQRLTKSLQKMAEHSYGYFHHRAHAASTVWGGSFPLDPAARRQWESITGRPIKVIDDWN